MFGVKGNWNVRGTYIKEEDTEGLLFVRGLRSGVDFLRKLIGYFIEETYSHECLHLEILGLRDSYNVLLVETFDREVLTILRENYRRKFSIIEETYSYECSRLEIFDREVLMILRENYRRKLSIIEKSNITNSILNSKFKYKKKKKVSCCVQQKKNN